jgi:hypothetical protein
MTDKYIRDSRSNAILESDLKALQLHRSRRKVTEEKNKKIETLEERISNLELIIQELTSNKRKTKGNK